MDDPSGVRKRRRVRLFQRYFLNPPMNLMAWAGLAPGNVLIETHGRRSGKRRRNVVGLNVDGDGGWVIAEQGRHAGWVRNIEAQPNVRVRRRGKWVDARATVVADDDPQKRLNEFGGRPHAAAVRRFGTALTTVHVEFTRSPGSD